MLGTSNTRHGARYVKKKGDREAGTNKINKKRELHVGGGGEADLQRDIGKREGKETKTSQNEGGKACLGKDGLGQKREVGVLVEEKKKRREGKEKS